MSAALAHHSSNPASPAPAKKAAPAPAKKAATAPAKKATTALAKKATTAKQPVNQATTVKKPAKIVTKSPTKAKADAETKSISKLMNEISPVTHQGFFAKSHSTMTSKDIKLPENTQIEADPLAALKHSISEIDGDIHNEAEAKKSKKHHKKHHDAEEEDANSLADEQKDEAEEEELNDNSEVLFKI
jgi:hypothetical protein